MLYSPVVNTPTHTRVQEYNLQGSVARLPDLNTERQYHACGHYTHNGQMVSKILFLIKHLNQLPHVSILTIVVYGAGVYSHRRMDWF